MSVLVLIQKNFKNKNLKFYFKIKNLYHQFFLIFFIIISKKNIFHFIIHQFSIFYAIAILKCIVSYDK